MGSNQKLHHNCCSNFQFWPKLCSHSDTSSHLVSFTLAFHFLFAKGNWIPNEFMNVYKSHESLSEKYNVSHQILLPCTLFKIDNCAMNMKWHCTLVSLVQNDLWLCPLWGGATSWWALVATRTPYGGPCSSTGSPFGGSWCWGGGNTF